MTKSRLYVVGGAVLAVMLALAWYFGSPRWTLQQMQSAAQTRDAEAMGAYIDFPALRTSVKDQLKAKVAAEMMKEENSGFAAIGAAFAMNLIEPMVDGLLSQQTMQAMFDAQPNSSSDNVPMGLEASGMEIERTSISEFHLVKTGDSKAGKIVFQRQGLGWKMTGLELPAE